jgi:hypothetical protein
VIRYKYQPQVQPPAPFVYVTLRNPITGQELLDVPAQLDTAADHTLLSGASVRALSLPRIRDMKLGVAGGAVFVWPVYPVTVAIHNLTPLTLEVVASDNEQWALLGRDILNAHRILLDGPQLALEIG